MKRGTLHKMINTVWNLWTATEIKIGCLFSILWLAFNTLVGGVDDQIQALVILVSLDILTGMVASCKSHSFASSVATRGLCKKAVMFLIIGLGVLLDGAMHTHMVRTMFIGAYAIIEAMSIVENIDKLGYGHYIPNFIRNALAQIAREKHVDKEGDKLDD